MNSDFDVLHFDCSFDYDYTMFPTASLNIFFPRLKNRN